jgi:hypothetical protein
MRTVAIKLNVFGRLMLAGRAASGWELFDFGNDGKRRRATDIVVPDFISEMAVSFGGGSKTP